MSLLEAFSWPYGPGNPETLSREFFEKLRDGIANGKSFPFLLNSHQISLVTSRSGTWFVAIMVITNSSTDDSIKIMGQLKQWFTECGAGAYQDYESETIRGNSIESSLGAGYTIIGTIDTKKQSNHKNQQTSPPHLPPIPKKSAGGLLPPPLPPIKNRSE
jgi:hypothetical protein